MERFKHGMGCCRPDRERVGLCCSPEQQVTCAVTKLASRFECAPADAGRLLSELIATFPDRLAPILAEANAAGRVRLFIERAARPCAALATKAERHAFRDQLTDRLCALDLAAFDDSMSAEWRRLRGK
ncbi:hypothetical protein L0Z31_21150 (plasmid) [Burkholderia vietnamiensis]|uniref:hypothetical protein n=1 Tax=Burkholderia vietnamiensis TaxID=60552 RepID=UPI0020192122|nr:hypothetical protein [Burkholderia vietnamiensis]MCO1349972.1 hypothetical protein [Burkholderia vietnamiensis]MCO1432442.1 hypothetical protein [Burkholderia vietnamiensis]UQN47396.1 hypothetical protein L0Y95_03765 [Burkholderia vietnamiensis]